MGWLSMLLNTPRPAGIPSRGVPGTLLVHSAPGLSVWGAVACYARRGACISPKSPTRKAIWAIEHAAGAALERQSPAT
jgi:hypothetical protein